MPTPEKSSVDPARVEQVLRERFGHDSLRPEQARAIRALLAGQDVLLILPTGGGKSLCYQLPALLLDQPTLVVSPLIALMEDQVAGLRARGIPASFVNSSLSAAEREQRLKAFAAGDLRLLYATPERFRSPAFRAALAAQPLGMLAIDEAHCISAWGQDFRPDYWQLGAQRAALNCPPTIALTATASAATEADIVTQLGLRSPERIRGALDRPNLFLAAQAYADDHGRRQALIQRLLGLPGPGIVYLTLIKSLESLAEELRRQGLEPLVYHGDLGADERRRMQQRFMASDQAVVLATNAFGLGIDKANTRFVLHAELPRNLEAWTQEFGRAGRDGAPAWVELFAAQQDLAVAQGFIQWANPDHDAFLRVYQALESQKERLADLDAEELTRLAFGARRSDGRVQTCLAWLESLGVLSGRLEERSLTLLRPLELERLPRHFGALDKQRRELTALLDIWRLAQQPSECRRISLARAFGGAAPTGPCGSCDQCTPGDLWRQSRGLTRLTATAVQSAEPRSSWERGDWVRIDGRFLGQIVQVERLGSDPLLIVEDPIDLRRRSVRPKRRQVERLSGPPPGG
jgi:ATP-dependent DNA helicase RecQ